MGWSIKMKKVKGETKYKIHSSISGQDFTKKWQSRDEIIKFFFWHGFRDFLEKFSERAETFPNGWREKGMTMIKSDEHPTRGDFLSKAIDMHGRSDEDWEEWMKENLDKFGIAMEVTEGEYGFSNKKESE